MNKMKYHEKGEKFEYNGVLLEVIETSGCTSCFFWGDGICKSEDKPMYCGSDTRADKRVISYKLVGLCEKKGMEQKTEICVDGADKEFAFQVTNNQSDEEIYGSLLEKLFTTYKAKNADYGSAFAEMFDELGIDYAYGKLREKMNRIKVLRKHHNMVENEGLEDALLDTAGYAILTLVEIEKRKS